MTLPPQIRNKVARANLEKLKEWFAEFDSVLVSFSGGVDSSVLAVGAYQALGPRAIAATSLSLAFAQSESEAAKQLACEIGIEHVFVHQDDLSNEDYVANAVERCYFCRTNLAQAIAPLVRERNIEVCVDGTHLDDLLAPRPGVRALRQAGFRAPFVELRLGKNDIRDLARAIGLSNSERPSEACLSSRVAYGQRIDLATLEMIERAEIAVKEILSEARVVRVRTIGKKAVIEVDQGLVEEAKKKLETIQVSLVSLGYEDVELEPNGYSSGRMLSLFTESLRKK